jgi:phage repressor protein C with HTH and peptisase S24 domain
MFIAHVVGRSMEPLIPDGSLCVFRAPVVGSRQGKKLLIEQFGHFEDGARYTVKRYTSQKSQGEDGSWEHSEIRLEPLNPEFEAFVLGPDDFRVVAEFIKVLE